MKTLYLVRHAKSDWDMEGLADIDRPLSPRGYRDAQTMSRSMNEKKLLPDLIISSPAVRAISTALIFSRNFKMQASEIIIKEDLYESSVSQYIGVLQDVDDRYKSIMLFGHNPTISDLASGLVAQLNDSLPTCAIVGIQFPANCKQWKNFEKASSELILYDFPKNHL